MAVSLADLASHHMSDAYGVLNQCLRSSVNTLSEGVFKSVRIGILSLILACDDSRL